MNKISSGLLLLLGAGALGVFWVNGYLATWTAQISGRVAGDTTKTPITLPHLAGAAGGGTPLLNAIPAVPLFGGIA